MKRLFGMMAAVGLLAISTQAWGGLLVSVEFGGSNSSYGDPQVQTGDDAAAVALSSAFSSSGQTWNSFLIPSYPTWSTSGSTTALVDRGTGLATGVGFSFAVSNQSVSSFNGVGGYGTVTPITHDTIFFMGGTGSTVNWEISGLTPGAKYQLALYGSSYGKVGKEERAINQLVDYNGDGLFTGESSVAVGATDANQVVLFDNLIAGSNGKIVGRGTMVSGEGDWSGFQIASVPVPEPSTIALLATGLIGLVAYAWRKRK